MIHLKGYLEDLFRYHHEKRNKVKCPTPSVPTWKGHDDPDEDEDEAPVTGGVEKVTLVVMGWH